MTQRPLVILSHESCYFCPRLSGDWHARLHVIVQQCFDGGMGLGLKPILDLSICLHRSN
jgi:hypothetical protein